MSENKDIEQREFYYEAQQKLASWGIYVEKVTPELCKKYRLFDDKGYPISYFSSKSTNIKQGTTYTVTLKEKISGVSIPNGGKSFTFKAGQDPTTKDGWEERKQFVIPVELELPEEILPVVKNIKASLLME